ncbi:MAG: acyl-CoA carboxylase subunit beta [Planctomycetota bacterium]
MTMTERIAELRERRAAIDAMGGEKRVAKQHVQGKLDARQRLDLLLDDGSFAEQNRFARHNCNFFGMDKKEAAADGVVTGSGAVAGRLVHAASQDFTTLGGAAGAVHCDKIVAMMDASMKTGSPFVFINDSGGARVQEGIDALAAYGRIFYHNTLLSGLVPQVSLICGPCAGGAAYSPALTDFIIQTKQAQMFITGPSVIQQVTGEKVTADELGGPEAQMAYSGVAHFIADDDRHAVQICQELLSYLPSNNTEAPPLLEPADALDDDATLDSIIPENPKQPYDMHEVIKRVVDGGRYLEVLASFAQNLIICFGRINGRSVGIIANQPAHMAGCLDIDASDKSSRFIRFCNAFNIPLVTLVDVPGFLPGVQQEYGGIIRHGAKMLFVYSAATVPKVSVILRKAYGGAYLAMSGKDLGTDRCAAWPTAEIAVMGAEGAASVVFRREIAAAEDPEARRQELIEEYRSTFSTPYVAAARRMVDDVIAPRETRRYLAQALETLANKREVRPAKKHGLIPL